MKIPVFIWTVLWGVWGGYCCKTLLEEQEPWTSRRSPASWGSASVVRCASVQHTIFSSDFHSEWEEKVWVMLLTLNCKYSVHSGGPQCFIRAAVIGKGWEGECLLTPELHAYAEIARVKSLQKFCSQWNVNKKYHTLSALLFLNNVSGPLWTIHRQQNYH